MHDAVEEYEYTEERIAALQWIWGDGYLSPGGAKEVDVLLEEVDLTDRHVLDIGCGLGAIDVLLVQTYGAKGVIGIDIEPPLIAHAKERTFRSRLDDRIRFQLVEPGPLPFERESFDVVFSKDAIIHIADKKALYRDVLRVLKPGGIFIGSDWLRGGEGEYSAPMKAWLKVIDLTFEMKNLEQTRMALRDAGFKEVDLTDRNDWYRQEIKNELAALSGDRYAELAKLIGEDGATHRLESSRLKQIVIERGELRPTHFVGYKSPSA